MRPQRAALIVGLLVCFWAGPSTAAPLEAVYNEAAAGVVLVLAGPSPGHRGPAGTSQAGFVVSPEGKVLTGAAGILGPNGHDPWDTIFVYVKPPQLQAQAVSNLVNRYRAQVIASAPVDGVSLALLQLEDAPAHMVPLIFGDPNTAPVGSEAVAIGHPEAAGLWAGERVKIQGLVDNFAHVPGRQVLLLDRGLSFGQWGGPLLDAGGRVLGIIVPPPKHGKVRRSRPASVGRGFALSSTAVVGWLAQNNMALAAPGAPPGGDPDSASDNPTPQPSTVAVDGPIPDAERARRQATEAAEGPSDPVVIVQSQATGKADSVEGAPAGAAQPGPGSMFFAARHPYSLHQILRQQMQSQRSPIPATQKAAPAVAAPHGAIGDSP